MLDGPTCDRMCSDPKYDISIQTRLLEAFGSYVPSNASL